MLSPRLFSTFTCTHVLQHAQRNRQFNTLESYAGMSHLCLLLPWSFTSYAFPQTAGGLDHGVIARAGARHYSPWYFVCNVLNPLPASVDCRHYLTHFTPSQCPSCQDFPKATQQTQMLNYFACVHPPCRGKELTLHFFGFAPCFC